MKQVSQQDAERARYNVEKVRWFGISPEELINVAIQAKMYTHNIHTVQARLVVRKRQNKINVPVFMPNILKGAYSTNMQRCMHPRFFFYLG